MKTTEELALYVIEISDNIEHLTPGEALQVVSTLQIHISAAIIQNRTLKDIFENGLYKEKEE